MFQIYEFLEKLISKESIDKSGKANAFSDVSKDISATTSVTGDHSLTFILP